MDKQSQLSEAIDNGLRYRNALTAIFEATDSTGMRVVLVPGLEYETPVEEARRRMIDRLHDGVDAITPESLFLESWDRPQDSRVVEEKFWRNVGLVVRALELATRLR